MHWDAIVAISQLVAAVGITLSLVFVGLQVRQNTAALQRNEHNSTMTQWSVIRMAIARDRDLAELMTAGLHGERALDAANQLRLEQMLAEYAWASFHIWDRTQRRVFPKGTFFGVYLLCGLFCWLIVPIFFALARYLQTKCKIFELTTQRLKITSGVFSKVTDTLELYRVKDIETRQPFPSRLVGVENVQMNTSDTSSPFVLIDAVPSSVGLADKLRNQVEIIRQQKRVREIDIE